MLLWSDQHKFGHTPLKIHDGIRGHLIPNNAFVFARDWNSGASDKKTKSQETSHTSSPSSYSQKCVAKSTLGAQEGREHTEKALFNYWTQHTSCRDAYTQQHCPQSPIIGTFLMPF
jgi:hypothetical protein